jgi:predicted transcriptional regulator
LPKTNKTKHPSKGKRKVQDIKTEVLAKKKRKPPTRVNYKGNMNKSNT